VLVVVVLAIAAVAVVIKMPPWAFLTREDLASCGEVSRGVTGEVPQDGAACLQTAQTNGTGAELKVTDYTTEADPIFTYYRVVPERSGMEIFIDSRDGYGKKGWTHNYCPQAHAMPDVGAWHGGLTRRSSCGAKCWPMSGKCTRSCRVSARSRWPATPSHAEARKMA